MIRVEVWSVTQEVVKDGPVAYAQPLQSTTAVGEHHDRMTIALAAIDVDGGVRHRHFTRRCVLGYY